MNAEHTKHLIEKYPVLYQGHKLPITQNLMSFGFEHGDGWFPLIDNLSALITLLDKRDGSETIAVQVKEKFGGLRYYIEGGTEAVWKAIEEAEALSERTCEWCGEPGTTRGGGWIYTLCDSCWSKKQGEEQR
jgi:hypothetical protein